MAKWYIDTLLNFQIFFISRAKFSFFVTFSSLVLGMLWAQGTAVSITSAVLFCPSMGAVSGLLKSTAVSVTINLSQYKNLVS
jgi:hypothetical protein